MHLVSAAYAANPPTAGTDPATPRSDVLDYLRNATEGVQLEVRVGFFGMCVHQPRAIRSGADWTCDSLDAVTQRYTEQDGSAISTDPLGLVSYLAGFSSQIIFYGLL